MSNSYFTTSTVSVNDTAWVEVLPADGARDTMAIQNQGDSVVYIGFDDVDDETRSIRVAPGAYFEPFSVPSNKIKLKAEFGGNTTVLVVTTYKSTIVAS